MIYVMSDSANYSFPYVNRDVSWMYFNHRILQEAMRPEVPPLYIPNRNDAGQKFVA